MVTTTMKRGTVKIGEFLKRFRKERGLTQQQVAEDIGIIPQLYQKYEWDKSLPSVEVVIALAKNYGVTTDYLLGLSDQPHPADVPAPIIDNELAELALAFATKIQERVIRELKEEAEQ